MDLAVRCLVAEMELEAKGWSGPEARAAVRYARRRAVGTAADLSPGLREQATAEFLEVNLRLAETRLLPRYREAMT